MFNHNLNEHCNNNKILSSLSSLFANVIFLVKAFKNKFWRTKRDVREKTICDEKKTEKKIFSNKKFSFLSTQEEDGQEGERK